MFGKRGGKGGLTVPSSKPPAAKIGSQSDAQVRTDAQINFLYYSLTTCTIINTVDSTCTITKNGLHSCKDTVYQTNKKESAGYLLIAGVFLKIIIWTHFKKLVNSNICSLPSRLVAITSINLCCLLIIASKLKHFQ